MTSGRGRERLGSRYRQLPPAILAAAVALAALAGCGGSASPLDTARNAATNTLSLTTQSTLTVTGARLFGGTPGTILGRAQYSFPRGLGYAAIQVPALGSRTSGPAYLVFMPQQVWIKPVVSNALPQGHLWITETFGGSRSANTTPSLALAPESLNPQLLLEEIATGAVAASSSGHGVINHVPFTEYAVTVDLVRSLATSKETGALRAAMQQELAALRAGGGTHAGSRVQIVARVDGAGRVAELQASLPGSKLGTVRIALRTFGSKIPLSLPLPSETVNIASLRRSDVPATARRLFTGE
jgi:hypothetical protein